MRMSINKQNLNVVLLFIYRFFLQQLLTSQEYPLSKEQLQVNIGELFNPMGGLKIVLKFTT